MAALVIPISSDSSIFWERVVLLSCPQQVATEWSSCCQFILPKQQSLPLCQPFYGTDDSKEATLSPEPAEKDPRGHESLSNHHVISTCTCLLPCPPGIRRRPAILVRPGEAIPFGRPYRTHPNGPRKLLTARKRVGPFPARRLAWRRVSHRSSDRHSSPDFTSDSSSSSSSSDSSSDISSGSSSDSYSDSSSVHSSGCDASGQSHSGPSTRVASPRLVDPPVRTPRCSEAFMRWRSAPLSTLYPPTTSESSPDSSSERSLDSSSPSAGPSRKRCRSPTTLVPSSTPVSRSIAPALADLPPRKRFRDSYSSEVSREEHMEIGTADAETVADLGISEGVGAHTKDGIDLGVEVATNDIREDEEEFEAEASAGGMMEIDVDPLATCDISEPTRGDTPDLKGTLYDISHYMSEVPLDRIIEFETTQRRLEAGRENLRVRALLYVKSDRVDSLRRHMALSHEEFRQVGRDRDDTRRRLRRMTPAAIEEMINQRVTEALETREANRNIGLGNGIDEGGNGNGNGNENGGGNGNGNHNENDRDARPVIRWFEKMETVFHISNCLEKYQVTYATCTLLNSALTWWNSHKRTIRTDAAFSMSWREVIKLMAEVYCPRTEIQKMESELWNLTVKNNDLAAYTQRF
ncbi:reverse transcriptase domain-containing protein [Tanacetum coccineum]